MNVFVLLNPPINASRVPSHIVILMYVHNSYSFFYCLHLLKEATLCFCKLVSFVCIILLNFVYFNDCICIMIIHLPLDNYGVCSDGV